MTDKGMEQLVDSSRKLLLLEPKATRFVSLGRTPIRMVQMLGLLNPNKQMDYVAFSGRFISRDGQLVAIKMPDMTKMNAYREYLKYIKT